MIAKIEPTFRAILLNDKIDYQLRKIEDGKAEELYNSSGGDLKQMSIYMPLMAELNDRVLFPFVEFVISLPVEDNLSNDKFTELANKYMNEMGYGRSCYSVIRNDDKDHSHVHILATTIDFDGNKISDWNNWSRSGKIAEKLEQEYNLTYTNRDKSTKKNRSLGESQYRQYFFDSALHKALKNYQTKEIVSELLNQSDMFKALKGDFGRAYSNAEWELMLNASLYEEIGSCMEKAGLFNTLIKDELLNKMDEIYPHVSNSAQFRERLEADGYYMRLVSKKDTSYYVYGVKDQSFYIKDQSLPQKYRFGHLNFNGVRMSSDEQKHFLYNKIFEELNISSDYDMFKSNLERSNIKVIELTNSTGIYGLSFALASVEFPQIFKASDISRKLTYNNIQSHYQKETKEFDFILTSSVDFRSQWIKDIGYMQPGTRDINAFGLDNCFSGRQSREEDDLPTKKRKRKRRASKGFSI